MSFSISLDVGKNGGLYFRRGYSATRLCLWRVALTIWHFEIDELLDSLADKIDPGWRKE